MSLVELAQWSDVVEDPESPSVRRHDEIIILNDEIAHRGRRQIQPQRLPLRAVIERHINALFRSREKQSFALGIFAHGVHRLARRDSVHNFCPRFAVVLRSENVRPQIVESQRVHCGVSGVRIEMSRFNQRNFLPGRDTWRRYAAPGFSAVGGQMNQPIIGSTPDAVHVERRWRDRIDHAATMRLLRRIGFVFSNARRQVVLRSR